VAPPLVCEGSEKAREIVALDAISYSIIMIPDKLEKTIGIGTYLARSRKMRKLMKCRAVTVDAKEQARHDVKYEILPGRLNVKPGPLCRFVTAQKFIYPRRGKRF